MPSRRQTGYDTHDVMNDALEAEHRRLAARLQETVISQANLILAQINIYEQTAKPQSRMAFSVLSALVQQLIRQSYDLEDNLNPSVLETLGLESALEVFTNQQRRISGVNVSLRLAKLRERLPAQIELVLFRITQDTVEAAIREGQATQIMIELNETENTLRYVVSDNGVERPYELLRSTEERLIGMDGEVAYGKSRYGGIEMRITFQFETPAELTEREMDVIRLVAQGLTNKEMALSLDVRPRTVKFHLDNIYGKLGVNTRTEAAIYALRQGWVDKIT